MSDGTLERLRQELDALDRELMELLGQRFEVCGRIAQYKREHQVPVMQTDRVKQVKSRAAYLGEALGVDPAFTDQLYTLIIGEACRIEDRVVARSKEPAG